MKISFKEKLLFCIIVILAGSFIFMGKYYDNFVQPLINVTCILREEGVGEDAQIVIDYEVKVEKTILLTQNIEITYDSIADETINVDGIQWIGGRGFTDETLI